MSRLSNRTRDSFQDIYQSIAEIRAVAKEEDAHKLHELIDDAYRAVYKARSMSFSTNQFSTKQMEDE